MLRELVRMWREAGWPARALFSALLGLFLFRAVFTEGSGDYQGDRVGFMPMGAQVLDRVPFEDPRFNSYPPTFAVVMAPLEAVRRALGDRPVRYAWGLAQVFAFVAFTLLYARALSLSLSLGVLSLGWLCTWRYFVGDLNYQNTTTLLLALVAAGVWRAARGRAFSSGVLLGAGAALKVWPGAALWPTLASGGAPAWRAAAGFALGVAAAIAAAVAALGPGLALRMTRFWLTVVGPNADGEYLRNQSWRGLFLRLLLPKEELVGAPVHLHPDSRILLARALAAAVGLALFLAVLALVALRRSRSPRVQALDAMLVILAMMPALPAIWYHYFTAELPIVLAVLAGSAALAPRMRLAVRALVIAGAVVGALLDADIVGNPVWAWAAFYTHCLWGGLMVLAAGIVVREAWRAADRQPGVEPVAAGQPELRPA